MLAKVFRSIREDGEKPATIAAAIGITSDELQEHVFGLTLTSQATSAAPQLLDTMAFTWCRPLTTHSGYDNSPAIFERLTKLNSQSAGRDGGGVLTYDGVMRYGPTGRVYTCVQTEPDSVPFRV